MSIIETISKYHFYHSIEVAPGIVTPGSSWAARYTEEFAKATANIDFHGKRVADIGCRDGALSFLSETRGAGEILAVDNDLSPAMTEFLIPHFRSSIKTLEANLYDLDKGEIGTFDIVIAAGLLYHLKYPLWGLRKLVELLSEDGILLLELGYMDGFNDFPLLHYAVPEKSPYDPTSPTFVNLACLRNWHEMLGMTELEILTRYDAHRYPIAERYPEFAKQFPQVDCLVVERAITSAKKSKRPSKYDRYFEGLHTKHRTGGAVI